MLLEKNFHSIPESEALKILNTNREGLREEEAKRRLKIYGYNELEEEEESRIKIFLRQFNNPLVYILIAAALIAFFLESKKDAGVIGFIILINAFLGYWQESKAIASIRALKKLTELKAKVVREGKLKEIPSREVVPGDIIYVEEGDVIPADARLIESVNLAADESILTGESVPVEKEAGIVLKEETPIYERKNILYKGTVVVRGRGKAVVFATGKNTEMGKIAEKVKEKSPKTPLQRALEKFAKRWVLILISILAFILLIGIYQGRDLYSLVMLVIAELVSSVPEGFPLVVTFILAIGSLRLARRKTLVKYLPAVETLGSATYICSDKTGTITEGRLEVKETYLKEEEKSILVMALCNNATENYGDPLEVALIKYLKNRKIDWENLRKRYKRVYEIPFDVKKRYMLTVHKYDGKYLILVKGAYEALSEISQNNTDEFRKIHDEFAQKGLRVIALGYRIVDEFEKEILENLRIELTGIVGFLDPPKKGVREAVITARNAGIKVIMITGDNPLTAKTVAKMVEIYREGDKVLLGKDIEKLEDRELYEVLKKTSVVARALPEHKYRIVKVLQMHKEIVAVTGDGVNDVPALKVADLGIAMGSGSQAAKDVAKMIILDNNLSVIVEAIRYGRVIVRNLRKAIYYLLSCSFGEIMLLTSSFLMKLPLPLYPIQILWINVVTEGVQDKTFPFGKEEEDVMREKPRRPEKAFLTADHLLETVYAAVLMGSVNVFLFLHLLKNHPYEFAIMTTFTSLVVNQWINGIESISKESLILKPLYNFKINPYMFLSVMLGFTLHAGAMYLFPEYLNMTPLTLDYWIYVLYTSVAFLFGIEIKKLIQLKLKMVKRYIKIIKKLRK